MHCKLREKKNKLIENVLQFVPVMFMSPWKNSHTWHTNFFKYLQFIWETQDFRCIESVIIFYKCMEIKNFLLFLATGIGLKTQEDGYEVKFRFN